MSVTKTVTFIAKEGHEAELRALLTLMVAPSKAEKGCMLYDIFEYKNTPGKFLVIESWEDEAALDGHKVSTHYAKYKANFEPHCAFKSSDDLDFL